MDDKEILIDAIVKGLAYTENGGAPDIDNPVAGKSGEMKSIFQFTPGTWKLYAKNALGDENAPLNADNETAVVRHKVAKWIDEGKTTSQIASMWNAGESRPDAYKQNWKGVNKFGVKYDTPAYAEKVLSYSKKFYEEKKAAAPGAPSITANSTPPVMVPKANEAPLLAQNTQKPPIGGLMGQIIPRI